MLRGRGSLLGDGFAALEPLSRTRQGWEPCPVSTHTWPSARGKEALSRVGCHAGGALERTWLSSQVLGVGRWFQVHPPPMACSGPAVPGRAGRWDQRLPCAEEESWR